MGRERERQREGGRDLEEARNRRARETSRVKLMRADETRNGGHAFREHVDVTPTDTARRARTGERARGGVDHPPPAHATRWTSETALARASERLWRSPEARAKAQIQNALHRKGTSTDACYFTVRMPLKKALGGDWREHVDGHSRGSGGQKRSHFTEHSQAVALWRMNPQGKWYLKTCFPEVTPRPDTPGRPNP